LGYSQGDQKAEKKEGEEMNILEEVPHRPEKPFMLTMEDEQGGLHVTWHSNKADLKRGIAESQHYAVYDIIEVCACREISIDEVMRQ
jgi:hypothetical protein